MKQGLLVKLLAINIPVVIFVISVLWVVLDTLAADYFSLLMKEYHINPGDAHLMFVHSVHRYLLWTSACALGLGTLLSFVLTRMVLRPLYQMITSARLIAGGDYTSRVPAGPHDEVGQLTIAFNQMSASIEHAERLRRDLVSNVAHELRTPLTNSGDISKVSRTAWCPPHGIPLNYCWMKLLDSTSWSRISSISRKLTLQRLR